MEDKWLPYAWMVTILVGLFIVSLAAVTIISWTKVPEGKIELQRRLVAAGSIVRLTTILLIVGSILVLRLRHDIEGEAAMAALSAIAGYVLGNERAARASATDHKDMTRPTSSGSLVADAGAPTSRPSSAPPGASR